MVSNHRACKSSHHIEMCSNQRCHSMSDHTCPNIYLYYLELIIFHAKDEIKLYWVVYAMTAFW